MTRREAFATRVMASCDTLAQARETLADARLTLLLSVERHGSDYPATVYLSQRQDMLVDALAARVIGGEFID